MIESSAGDAIASRAKSSSAARERFADSATLLSALVVAGLAASLMAAGAMVPVVDGAEPAFTSAPLLDVLAFLPVAVATALVLSSRHAAAAGVLVGAAALAPGRLVLDLQFAADPSVASRPELYMPGDLVTRAPATGLWLLLAGHLAAAVAGLLALRSVGVKPTVAVGAPGSPEPSVDADEVGAQRWRQRWLLVVVVTAVIAACGLLMAPFGSEDVYLLGRNAFEGPAAAMAGYLLLACALPVGAAFLITSSATVDFARGGLAGLAVGVAALAAPHVVSGASLEAVDLSAGPLVALVGAAGLLAVAATRPHGRVESGASAAELDQPGHAPQASVPGQLRLQLVTGVLAMLTAIVAVIGSFTAQVSTGSSAEAPESPARWLLLVSGLVVGVLGSTMFVPAVAAAVRPVLSVAWVAVLVAGTAVLDTAITATGVPGTMSAGPGVLWTWLAMFAAVVAACCSAVTGIVERENAEATMVGGAITRAGLNMLAPLAAAAILAVAAFGMPVVVAPDYVEPGLWSDFGTPSWGLLAGAITVLAVLALATISRPVRAAGLLIGVAAVLGLRAAALPLSEGHIEGAGAGPGVWLALAGAAAALIAAVIAAADARSARGRVAAEGER
ncbi:hypothetical protein FHU38_004474 [Saccharomonospora amisosensis]|uniref:Uncharacterized protein n=1 Tax=Saccharomonospora amisosensis TaxID=1128677 RepID=A0A7X5UU14_9PSEU|nr:hypothetical protein [Saccharomonospora amisosensis]NIJ14130.1 hypothetical protein [Saccharomonospora amisosensis]